MALAGLINKAVRKVAPGETPDYSTAGELKEALDEVIQKCPEFAALRFRQAAEEELPGEKYPAPMVYYDEKGQLMIGDDEATAETLGRVMHISGRSLDELLANTPREQCLTTN